MSEYRWVRVAARESIPPREGRAVQLGPHEIAIFHVNDRFLAIENRCPHSGGPLCDGIVTGTSVVCPLHAWKISLEDGCVQRPSGADAPPVATYPVHVENGIVAVGIPRPSVVAPLPAPCQAAAEALPST